MKSNRRNLALVVIFAIMLSIVLPTTIVNATTGSVIYVDATSNAVGYNITIPSNGTGEYSFETDKNGTDNYDTVLYLCKVEVINGVSTNVVMSADDDGRGYGAYSKIISYLNPGSYKLIVKEYDTSKNIKCTITMQHVTSTSSISTGTYYSVSGIPYDEYKLSVSSTATYRIETSYNTDSSADTYLFLYDNKHNVLSYNDDLGQGTYYSRIEYALAPGNYFIRVRAFSSGSNINCKLKVDNIGSGSTPSVSLSAFDSNGYFLNGNSFNVYGNSSIGQPALFYQGHKEGDLTSQGGTSYYLSWVPQTWVRPYAGGMPVIRLSTNYSGSYGYAEQPGYVTMNNLAGYQATDPSFTYTSPTAHNFKALATGHANEYGVTGTYNCLAYSVGITSNWEWPSTWGDAATFDQVNQYMNSNGYTQCNLTEYPKIICYGSTNSIGHFAKVTNYKLIGGSIYYPDTITSKWGGEEVIQSDTYNPFSSVYGSATYYFK